VAWIALLGTAAQAQLSDQDKGVLAAALLHKRCGQMNLQTPAMLNDCLLRIVALFADERPAQKATIREAMIEYRVKLREAKQQADSDAATRRQAADQQTTAVEGLGGRLGTPLP
jgi:hypothetical protein